MASNNLPHPDDFGNLTSPELKTFPQHLPVRPDNSTFYLSTLFRNNKRRIVICTISFLVMIGGAIVAALLISRAMERINEGKAALSIISSLSTTKPASTPLRFTLTKTTMVTQTSVVTGWIMVPISWSQLTAYAAAKAPFAPTISCRIGDTGVTYMGAASGPEKCGVLFEKLSEQTYTCKQLLRTPEDVSIIDQSKTMFLN